MTTTRLIDHIGRGAFANRPAPAAIAAGMAAFYWATDTKKLYAVDATATGWDEVIGSSGGGGGGGGGTGLTAEEVMDVVAGMFLPPTGNVVPIYYDTVDKIALNAPTGGGGSPAVAPLFSALGTATFDVTADVIDTGGHSAAGIGFGKYGKTVGGVTMTNTLAGAHPLFIKGDATAAYRGLLPTGGRLFLSQSGYAGTGNAQPAFQALINYAKLIGCKHIVLDYASLDLWTPTRVNVVTDQYAQNGDCVMITADMFIEGLPGRGTTVNQKGTTGGDINSQTQIVSGQLWRGSAITVIGGTSASPGLYNVAFFGMRNVTIDGGRTTTKNNANADVTHKGLRIQDTVVGRVYLDNVEMKNFGGEIYYMAANNEVEQRITNCWFHHSDQSAFNPSRGYAWVENSSFGDTYLAAEFLSNTGSVVNNCRFYNSDHATMMGGRNNGYLYNYGYPNRDLTKQPDFLYLNGCKFESCGNVYFTNYVRGSVYATDTGVIIDATLIGSATSVDLDVHAWLDQDLGIGSLVNVYGPTSLTTVIPGASAPNYIKPIADVHIRLHVHQTARARAAHVLASSGFRIKGYFDSDTVSLHLVEGNGLYRISDNDSAVVGYPLLKTSTPTDGYYWGAGIPNGSTVIAASTGTLSIPISSPAMEVNNSGGASGTVNVTPASAVYPHGFTARIYYAGSNTGGVIYSFARDGTRLRLNATRQLTRQGDYLELTYDAQIDRWHESGYHGVEAA